MRQDGSSFFRSCGYFFDCARSQLVNRRDAFFDVPAASFYEHLSNAGGYSPDSHIDVLPEQRLIYLCVPKCATSTIKLILSALVGRGALSLRQLHKRKYSGLKSPSLVGLSAFHDIATDPATLRFSFVRNPYARLVSAWADKYQNKSLNSADSFVDQYRTHRWAGGTSWRRCANQSLSFAEFVDFATATARLHIDAHWQLQDHLLNIPSIKLDFVGKVETFDTDIVRVLDHVGADARLRHAIGARMNRSCHQPWPSYYTGDLAARVYRAYERDFDRFKYPRRIAAESCLNSVP